MTMGETARSAGEAGDATALEMFQNQWDVYRKFLKYDYLSNGAACRVLRRYLREEVARPFRILDLACGDASGVVGALASMPVEGYRGVDLAAPALEIAARNLAALACPVELEEADFTTALNDRTAPEDVVWISLSLHHLDTDGKRAFMHRIRAALQPGGAFLAYEPTSRDGEDRAQYLDRLESVGRSEWTELSPSEFADALRHVRTCDRPEAESNWVALGAEAGFASVSELYRSPSDLFRLYLYRP